MSQAPADESVEVRLEPATPIGAYTVNVSGSRAGRADFVDVPEADSERIFFHTEIDASFAGRGLGGVLVRDVLLDSIRRNIRVVPVCPLFARHLDKHGDEFLADGGAFRKPAPADLALVRRVVAGRS